MKLLCSVFVLLLAKGSVAADFPAHELRQAGRPAEAAAASFAGKDVYPPQMLADKAFRKAYHRALGESRRERWLARLEGPGVPVRPVRIGGGEYRLVAACKAHDCYENNLVVVFAPASGRLLGKVLQSERPPYFIGDPDGAEQAELDRLWREEWRP